MKKLILMATMVGVSINIYAQGTVDFRNRVGSAPNFTVNAPVGDPNGTPIGNANYVAQLYYGPAAASESSLTAVADLPSPFRTGTGAGFWNPGANTVRTLVGIAGGANANVQVRVWDNVAFPTGYDTAASTVGAQVGKSTMFTMATGGGGTPPGPAAFMTGLTAFNTTVVPVPEPSTIALGVLGAVFFLMRKRM